MLMSSAKQNFQKLYKVAYSQDGYFTALQALEAGYSFQSQSYHIKNGDWEREWRGIYRLSYFPRPDYPDLMILYLWTCNRQGIPQGVISHDKALDMYNLGSWTLQKNTMTVPPGFRRNAAPPGDWKYMVLHHANLRPDDIKMFHHVPFTTPLKTIVDLLVAEHVPQHYLWEAINDALYRGMVTHKQMIQADLTAHERNLLVNLLKGIDYDKPIKEAVTIKITRAL
jgi:predicted transcriptional regulator of viral defense system